MPVLINMQTLYEELEFWQIFLSGDYILEKMELFRNSRESLVNCISCGRYLIERIVNKIERVRLYPDYWDAFVIFGEHISSLFAIIAMEFFRMSLDLVIDKGSSGLESIENRFWLGSYMNEEVRFRDTLKRLIEGS